MSGGQVLAIGASFVLGFIIFVLVFIIAVIEMQPGVAPERSMVVAPDTIVVHRVYHGQLSLASECVGDWDERLACLDETTTPVWVEGNVTMTNWVFGGDSAMAAVDSAAVYGPYRP